MKWFMRDVPFHTICIPFAVETSKRYFVRKRRAGSVRWSVWKGGKDWCGVSSVKRNRHCTICPASMLAGYLCYVSESIISASDGKIDNWCGNEFSSICSRTFRLTASSEPRRDCQTEAFIVVHPKVFSHAGLLSFRHRSKHVGNAAKISSAIFPLEKTNDIRKKF